MAETAWSPNAYVVPQRAATSRRRRPLTPAHGPYHAPQRRHRTIFISDVHLGTRGCKAELLADFLARNTCDTLYLVGDIVDGWQLRRRWYWTEAQTRVVSEILRKVDEGVRVIYVPGNHDEFLRDYCGRSIAGIEVVHETIHETAAGLRLLVLHGDQFDGVIGYAKWLAHLGDRAYGAALALNDRLHVVRRSLGLPYWSLSAYLKRKVKNAVEYVSRFEEVVARAAAPKGVDGVLCGHIHQAEIRRIGPILYLNDGDWVESCTALVEDARGHLEILRWASSSPASDYARAGSYAPQEAALIPV
ncbi:MAG: UDP-2,3-diacylglucosamine diphosphatase [Alphaproteobacteria bacterium]|nr:UDP-2,3-diacylglucosamine diphosphatase [Alphaproteobacteria bacterium]